MKALYCKKCKSLFNINKELKKCKCGKTKGKYLNWHSAIYTGKHAVPIGIENPSFQKAILDCKTYGNTKIEGMTLAHSHFVAYTMVQSNLTYFFQDSLDKIKIKEKKVNKKKKARKKDNEQR